jgi:hypothetical protein
VPYFAARGARNIRILGRIQLSETNNNQGVVVKKFITGVVLAAGLTGASLALAAPAFADPLEGHWENCTGEYDGSTCWHNENGVVVHLDI